MIIESSEVQQKKVWISSTGCRILIELKALMEAPRSIEELIEIAKNDFHLNKEISADTVRCDIRTLRTAGCIIEKPSKASGHKLRLVFHPFKLNISKDELDVLIELREKLASEIPLNEVFILNDLYDKIAALTLDNGIKEFIKNTAEAADIDRNIVKELSSPALAEKRVNISYKSPKYGIENIDIIPIKLLYENKKVYLCAYNFKYDASSYFEVSKILKINSVSINKETVPDKTFRAVYEVSGEALNSFTLKPYEKIIEQNADKIKVEAEPDSEFMFIQRLLLLGRDFKLILPEYLKDTLINKIRLIKKRYQ